MMGRPGYNLTFKQAFLAMMRGCVVANAECNLFRFKIDPKHGQQFVCKCRGGWGPLRLIGCEVGAKWRVVPTKGHPNA